MMRVFLYEFTCGPGLPDHPGSSSLQTEGRAMLTALLNDFGHISGIEATTLLSAPQARELLCGHGQAVAHRVARAEEEEQAFRELAAAADYTLVVAPEFEELLLKHCRWVEEVGGRLLGPAAEAVRLSGDKLVLAHLLRDRGLPTPAALPFVPGLDLATVPFPAVYKPRSAPAPRPPFYYNNLAS